MMERAKPLLTAGKPTAQRHFALSLTLLRHHNRIGCNASIHFRTGGIDHNVRFTRNVRPTFGGIGSHEAIVCRHFRARNIRQIAKDSEAVSGRLNHSFTSHSKASKRVLKAGKSRPEKLFSWS
jgi:hypothetical protein